ncbi:ABC transporter ATP-binding protein, partial [Desulfobacteraceae bacterium SEEP-SAG9]
TGKISISGMASELQQNAKVQEAYLGGTALASSTPAVPS